MTQFKMGELFCGPGGIAYENFEYTELFRNGQSYVFGITPETPEEFIKRVMK